MITLMYSIQELGGVGVVEKKRRRSRRRGEGGGE